MSPQFTPLIIPVALDKNQNCRSGINWDIKQARMATVVNKQLNFSVKNKQQTTTNVSHIWSIFYDSKYVKELYIYWR